MSAAPPPGSPGDARPDPGSPGAGTVPPPSRLPLLRRLAPVPFAVFALAVIFFLYQFIAGGITLVLFGTSIVDDDVTVVRLATLVGQIVFMLLPTVLLAMLRRENTVEFFRLRLPDYRGIILTAIGTVALQQLLQGYMAVQDAVPLPSPLQRILEELRELFEQTYRLLVTARSPGEFIFVVLVVALTPAVCEEMLFRGLVQRSFERVTEGAQGAVIAGLIFGGFHLVPTSFVPLAVLGVYFGFIAYRSRSIVLAVSAHFLNNFVACTAVYLELNDEFVAIAPHQSPTPPLVFLNTVVFALVFVVSTYYFVRVTEPSRV